MPSLNMYDQTVIEYINSWTLVFFTIFIPQISAHILFRFLKLIEWTIFNQYFYCLNILLPHRQNNLSTNTTRKAKGGRSVKYFIWN